MPYGGTTPEQDKKIERCVASNVAKGIEKKKAIKICKSSVLGKDKQESKPVVYENVKLNWRSPLNIIESIKADENSRKIQGMALPAAESRNGRTYKLEDIRSAKFGGKDYEPGRELLIGLDHSDTVTDNVGKWVPTFEENGIGFRGMAFNTGKHPYITDMLDKGLLPFVSIEAMADLVKEKEVLTAKNLDVLGFDFVKHPGMVEAHANVAEAFENALVEKAAIPEPKQEGDEMTEEILKEEETNEEETEQPEETKEEKVEVKSEKVDDSKIDQIFEKLKASEKKAEELSEEIKKLKEKPKSKGVVTEKPKSEFNLKTPKRSDGYVDIYSEDKLY